MDVRFEYHKPADASGLTFVGYNALTGDLSMWENSIGKSLREAGHGTLFWNLRGQEGTPVTPYSKGHRRAVWYYSILCANQAPGWNGLTLR